MKRVLIVDDEEDFCYFMKKNLEVTGNFEVSECCDSREAMQQAQEIHPDLILLDVMMPEMDGQAVAAKFKANKNTKDIPIIFVTALVIPQETEKNKNFIGGSYFIAKPVNIKELISMINELIQ